MAIIDRAKENVRMNVSSPVPIGGTEFAGARGRALEQVGDKLIGVGVNLYKADAASKATKASVELESFYKSARLQAEQTSAADGSDIEEKYNDIVVDGSQKIKDKYSGNLLANTQIENYDNQARQGELTNLQSLRVKKAEAYHSDVIEQTQAAEVNKIYNAKNNFEMKAYLSSAVVSNNNLIDQQVQNGVISPTKAYQLKEGFRGALADNMLDGAIQRKDFGQALAYVGAIQEDTALFTEIAPDEAKKLGFVTGQEADQLLAKGEKFKVPVMTKKDKMKSKLTAEEAYVMSALPQGKRESLRQKLEGKMQMEASVKLSDLNQQINGFERLAFSGVKIPDKAILGMLNQVNSNPLLTKESRIRLANQIVTASAINTQVQRLSDIPRAEQGKLLEDADKMTSAANQRLMAMNPHFKGMEKDFAVQGYKLEAQEKLKQAIANVNTLMDKDSAGFFVQTDQSLQTLSKASADAGHTVEGTAALRKFNDALLAKQKFVGAPQNILSSQQASEFATNLKGQVNSAATYNYLMTQKQKFGDHFPRAMSELIKADKTMSPYSAITYADPNNVKDLLDGIKNKPAIDKEFKPGGSLEGIEPEVKRQISDAVAPFRKMFVNTGNDSGNLGMIQGIQEAVEIQAKRDIVQKNMTPSEAVKEAYGKVIADQYHIVENGRNSVLVPKALAPGRFVQNPNMIEGFLSVYSNSTNFSDLNISVPKSEGQGNKDEYYAKLGQRTKWVTNSDQSGIRLMEVVPESGDLKSVYDTYGRPVEKSYDDIHYNTPDKVKNGGVTGVIREKFLKDRTAIRSKF